MKLLLKLFVFGCIAVTLIGGILTAIDWKPSGTTQHTPTAPAISPTQTAAPTNTAQPVPTETPQPTSTPAPTAIPEGYMSRAIVGDKWPLLVEDGIVKCTRLTGGILVITFTSGGVVYAINGMAKVRVDEFGWELIESIQNKELTEIGLLKYPVTPLLDTGMALCR